MLSIILSALFAISEPDPSWVEQSRVELLQKRIEVLEAEVMRLEEELDKEIPLCSYDADDLTFMDYRAVTDRTSRQYYFRTHGYTGSNGLRMYNGFVQIAVGNYYGKVGDYLKITFSNGYELYGIVGDSKGNRCHHTDGNIRSQVELLVDDTVIPRSAWTYGTFNHLIGDKIIKIERID